MLGCGNFLKLSNFSNFLHQLNSHLVWTGKTIYEHTLHILWTFVVISLHWFCDASLCHCLCICIWWRFVEGFLFCRQILALFLHQVRLFPTPQRCTNFLLARSHQPINTLKRGCSIPLIGRRGQNRGLFAMSKDSPYKYCHCHFVLGQSVFVFSSGEPCSGFCSAGRPSPAPACREGIAPFLRNG